MSLLGHFVEEFLKLSGALLNHALYKDVKIFEQNSRPLTVMNLFIVLMVWLSTRHF